jgi:putative ABC transport system permease protein
MSKRKLYVAINIVGLALGLAACMLMMLYVGEEVSYDNFHEKADRIYRVNSFNNFNGEDAKSPKTPPPLGNALLESFSEVEAYTILGIINPEMVRHGDNVFSEKNILTADSSFFSIFSFRFLEGDPGTALKNPYSVVMTKATARKYFRDGQALGQTISFGTTGQAYKVTGVIGDIPSNSHFHFDLLTSITSNPVLEEFEWSWVWQALTTYVLLRDGADADRLAGKLPGMVRENVPATFTKLDMSFDEFRRGGGRWEYQLQPLRDIRLRSMGIGNQLGPIGDVQNVYIFGAVGLFVILLACINFMNLATARSLERAQEVGVRKALGADKPELIWLFLTESVVISLVAALLAVVLVLLVLPHFNELSSKQLSFFGSSWWAVVLMLLVLPVVTGLFAGSYPAFYLTSFNPVHVLEGKVLTDPSAKGNLLVRNGLVIFQFFISITLIICTLVVNDQLRFVRSKHLGFAKENVLVISNAERLESNTEAFKQALASNAAVQSVSVSSSLPSKPFYQQYYLPEQSKVKKFMFTSLKADHDLVPTLNIRITHGRNFSRNFQSDREGVLINEVAVRNLGWANPVGKKFRPVGEGPELTVIGVMKDFHFISLKEHITPFAVFHADSPMDNTSLTFISVKITPGREKEVLEWIKDKWAGFAANKPFDYSFLDDDFAALYQSEVKMGRVFNLFSGLSIVIACFGLLGLVSFMTEKNTKEIGIRKVLGATEAHIVLLYLKAFARLILVAFAAAVPVVYLAMNHWLDNFAYHVNLHPLNFVLAGIVTLLVASVTITFVSLKAAFRNPVDALRSE